MKKVFGLFLSLIVFMGLWSCEQELPEDSKKPNPEESMCLTFVSSGESSVTLVKVGKPFDISLEYSLDGTNWNPYTIGETIYLLEDKLSFRAGEQGNRRFSKGVDDYYQFVFSGEIAARGSIMSLLDRSDLKNVMPSYAFFNLFRDCTGLTKAPELPVMNLAERCYWGMFSGCTSLNEAPDLPATNLAKECYYGMFDGCTGLKKAPELPATELAEHCYSGMFNGCTSLTKAPELPATELAGGCYSNMFNSCTSLTKTPELPAMKLAEECYYYMFWGCTDLTEAPVLSATELAGLCYYGMFGGCTSLTKAPELPAMKLVDNCYCEMFYRCENLSYIKALFTDKPSKETTRNWVYGVATTGTFVKSKDATWYVRGDNGIPKGWTVEGGAFSAILAVIGTNDNAIIVSDACETVKLTVKSNLSWTASYDTDWIKIDPASIENTDGEVVSTKVSVVFEKNTYKERSAEIKFVAEGVEPVIITAKQHAEESILCVWDMDKFAPSEDPSISTSFLGGQHSFTIHANVDWTATCPSWITLDPTSNKYDGQTQNVTVKAVLAVNDEEDARMGEIKFVGEGVADLVIPVKQAKAASGSLYPWAELPVMYDADRNGVHDNDPYLYYATHFTDLKSPTGGAARNYTVCFSGEHHCPVWVAAPRHQMYQVKGTKRTDAYKSDPKIPADIQYYSKSIGGGCNKGHMLGSAERVASRTTNEQVFYYSNIAPQLSSGFNTGGGGWNILEEFVDGQVCSDTLYVVIGCYFDKFTDGYGESASPKTIAFGGRNDVDMPTMFYYALLRTKKGNSGKSVRNCSASEIQCAAFVRTHTNSLKGQRVSSKEMMSISDLEKITGIRYFENVPNAPKTSFKASEWGL